MTYEEADFIEITPVRSKPRWRLAYCNICSDGYRGGAATANKWAREHFEARHA